MRVVWRQATAFGGAGLGAGLYAQFGCAAQHGGCPSPVSVLASPARERGDGKGGGLETSASERTSLRSRAVSGSCADVALLVSTAGCASLLPAVRSPSMFSVRLTAVPTVRHLLLRALPAVRTFAQRGAPGLWSRSRAPSVTTQSAPHARRYALAAEALIMGVGVGITASRIFTLTRCASLRPHLHRAPPWRARPRRTARALPLLGVARVRSARPAHSSS